MIMHPIFSLSNQQWTTSGLKYYKVMNSLLFSLVRVSSGILQQLLLLGREAFYKQLVDLVKKSLRKGTLLFWDKL